MKLPPLFAVLLLPVVAVQAGPVLPGTEPLTWDGDLSGKMHLAALAEVDRLIADAPTKRAGFWHRDATSPAAYEHSIEENRRLLAARIGLVDARTGGSMERFGDDANPALVAETAAFSAFQVRWPVHAGITAEGLLLEPKERARGFIVALGDADETPEQLAGLAPGIAPEAQTARLLAERGFCVAIPTLIDRSTAGSGNAEIVMTNQPHREWIHRQAYMMGRHIIGYEAAKVMAAIDWQQRQRPGLPVGVAGYGEGGLVAFYSAAIDPRISTAWIRGYFKDRQQTWSEPLFRNVWGLLREFGDAEIATLIAPRALVVEFCPEPAVEGPPPVAPGQKNCAAPGRLATPDWADVEKEFNRIGSLLPERLQPRTLVRSPQAGLSAFLKHTVGDSAPVAPAEANASPAKDRRKAFDPAVRQLQQMREMEAHVQHLVQESPHVRDNFFLYALLPQFRAEPWTRASDFPPVPIAPFVEGARAYRRLLYDEIIGRLEAPLPAPRPRTRQIYDRPRWTGWEVVLDVGGNAFSWGILCVPKDLGPGERRPVVVCQHGRHGLPRETIEGDSPSNHDFAARLADRGFITFAPHNLYQKEDYYRTLSRKANTVHASMFSFILRHHEQILHWLGSLPFVDPSRIGFYGHSYGGESAVRIPPLLEGYSLSICSGDFNDWARKVASTDDRHSFMFTDEWEMPYFNLGNTFSYAEMTYLMLPRPFMAERGHHDGVAPDEWVAWEFARTRFVYDQFGLGDRTGIDFFNGGHTIHSVVTFNFLQRWLNWPAPAGK